MQHLQQFFAMGGYGFYVWTAYSCTFLLLLSQWLGPWRRASRHFKKIDHE